MKFEQIAGDFEQDGWALLRPDRTVVKELRHVAMTVAAVKPVLQDVNERAKRTNWRLGAVVEPPAEGEWTPADLPDPNWASQFSGSSASGSNLYRLAHVTSTNGFSRLDATMSKPPEIIPWGVEKTELIQLTRPKPSEVYISDTQMAEARRRVYEVGHDLLQAIGAPEPPALGDDVTHANYGVGKQYEFIRHVRNVGTGEACVAMYEPGGRIGTKSEGHRDAYYSGVILSVQTTPTPTEWLIGDEADPDKITQHQFDVVVLNSDPGCPNKNPYHGPLPHSERMAAMYVADGQHEFEVRQALGLPLPANP